jgi:uncharacterized DUF497 family protein
MRIVWDEPKRLANRDKHGADFADLSTDFFAGALVRPVRSGRLQAVGRLGDGTVTVIFKPLGSEAVSVISMRRANKKERKALQ